MGECEDETLPANMKWMKEKSTEERKMRKRKVCQLCGAAKTDEGFDLYWCAGCKKVRYCGLECHHGDWERHKEYCRNFRKERRKRVRAFKKGKRAKKESRRTGIQE